MKRMQFTLIAVLVFGVFITGCKKDPLKQLTPEESRIYITSYDSSANFSAFKTFSIADSVGAISNNGASRELTATDQAYVTAVKKYMQQAGYTLVSKDQHPDIAVNVNRIYNTSTGVIDYTDYWDYYGGYWDPTYWGYSGYSYYVPYTYGVYQVTEGLISIDMFDLKNAKESNKLNLLWNGLIRGEGIMNSADADASVQALFSQSSYLHTTQ